MTGHRKHTIGKAKSHPAPGGPGTSGRPGQPKHILIVDEDMLSIVNISQFLLRSGYVLSHATDEDDAINVARNEKPDLIIFAMDGSRGDSFQLERSLQSGSETKPIPILFVLDSDGKPGHGPQILGPRTYLTRPFTQEQLSAAVREQLAHVADLSLT